VINASSSPEASKPQIGNPANQQDPLVRWILDWQVRCAVQVPGQLPTRSQSAAFRNKMDAVSALKAAITPKDAIDDMLITQMVALHQCAMENINGASQATDIVRREYWLNNSIKLMSTFAKLVVAQNKRNGQGEQKITVRHLHVEAGGQAAIGNFDSAPHPAHNKQTPKEIAAPTGQPMEILSDVEPRVKEPSQRG
jgi:hypothetical protein